MKLKGLLESVSKKPVPDHVKTIIYEIFVDDVNGEDVEVPYVTLHI